MEKNDSFSKLRSTDKEPIKFDRIKIRVKQMSTVHGSVGNICAIKTTILQ